MFLCVPTTNSCNQQPIYRNWCLQNSFESKLPGDIKKRNEALAAATSKQQTLDAHLQELPEKQRNIVYTEQRFREAAIEWLIATNQVSTL